MPVRDKEESRTLEEIDKDSCERLEKVLELLDEFRRERLEEEDTFNAEEGRGRGRPAKADEKKAKGSQVYLLPNDKRLLTTYHGKTIGKILKRLALEECERIRNEVAELT